MFEICCLICGIKKKKNIVKNYSRILSLFVHKEFGNVL